MSLSTETHKLQSQLANYCRDGKLIDIEGARKERLPHYRRLVYNVMYGLQEKSYPILKSILSEAEFKSMIDQFLIEHEAQAPQVWRVPREFFEFVDNNHMEIKDRYPYLRDLMFMEWLEILVYNRKEKEIGKFVYRNPDLDDKVILNPDFELHAFEFPVHKGDWETIESKRGNYFLLLFRNLESKKVHFVEISPLHADILYNIQDQMTLRESFEAVLNKYQISGDRVEDQLMNFIYGLYNDGFVLGVAQS